MKHIVLVKFKEDFLTEEVFLRLKKDYEALSFAMPASILSVILYKNCVKRDANMDIMIEMQLSKKDDLSTYLSHPIHVKIGEVMNPYVVSRTSFDYEE